MTIVGSYFWLGTVNLSPDSVTYMSVANNLKNYGELFKWVNWPSANMLPQVEPFTDFAPALMLLSYPFILVFGNPLTSIIVLQIIIIAFYGLINYILARELFGETIVSYLFVSTMMLFPLFIRVETFFWTELPFISLTFLSIYFIIKFLESDDKSYLLRAALVIMISCLFKYIGVFNISLFIIIYLFNKIKFRELVKYTIISLLGISIWFSRNYIIYGAISRSHSRTENFNFNSLIQLYDKLAVFNPILPIIAILFVVILIVFVLLPVFLRKEVSNSKYKILLGLAFTHLTGIVLLSIVAQFDSLGARLLSPTIAVFIVALATLLFNWGYIKITKKRVVLISTYIVVLIIINAYISRPNITSDKTLKEMKLWEFIHSKKKFDRTTHFYSEFDLKHEFYCEMPMRVIYNEDLINESYVKSLLKIGQNPIFIYKVNSLGSTKMDLLLDNCKLSAIDTLDFKIYYLEGI